MRPVRKLAPAPTGQYNRRPRCGYGVDPGTLSIRGQTGPELCGASAAPCAPSWPSIRARHRPHRVPGSTPAAVGPSLLPLWGALLLLSPRGPFGARLLPLAAPPRGGRGVPPLRPPTGLRCLERRIAPRIPSINSARSTVNVLRTGLRAVMPAMRAFSTPICG